MTTKSHTNGLVQERRNSFTNALEFSLSYTNPSIPHQDYEPNQKYEYEWRIYIRLENKIQNPYSPTNIWFLKYVLKVIQVKYE